MGRKIQWTNKPAPKTNYYYICNLSRKKVIVLYLDKNEKIADGDVRSKSPLNVPDPPLDFMC